MRAIVIVVLVAAVALASATAGSARHAAPLAPGRCCFMVQVDVTGAYFDTYHGNATSQWVGEAYGSWDWSTRFVASFTGKGVDVGVGGFAMAGVGSVSGYHYDVLLDPFVGQTGFRHDPHTCGAQPDANGATPTADAPTYRRVSPTSLMHTAHGQLLIGTPKPIELECPGLGGDEPGAQLPSGSVAGTNPNKPYTVDQIDELAMKEPSLNNFLGGSSFDRACYQMVQAEFQHPTPHHFGFNISYGVTFRWFPRKELPQKTKSLAGVAGKQPTHNAAWSRAIDADGAAISNYANGQPAQPQGCS